VSIRVFSVIVFVNITERLLTLKVLAVGGETKTSLPLLMPCCTAVNYQSSLRSSLESSFLDGDAFDLTTSASFISN
jgi:hypothetical protein